MWVEEDCWGVGAGHSCPPCGGVWEGEEGDEQVESYAGENGLNKEENEGFI